MDIDPVGQRDYTAVHQERRAPTMAMLEPRPWQQPRAKTRLVPEPVNAVDELARVRKAKAELEEEEKELVAKVRAMGEGEHRGGKVIAEVSSYQKESLDIKGLRVELPEAMIAKHTKTSTVTSVRIKPLA